jgi:arabinogalactan oligomer / maltooligosaccharide transport system permease protein
MAQPAARPTPGNAAAPRKTNRSGTSPWTIAAYLTPALIAVVLVNIVPIFYNLYMSFTNRNGPRRFAEGRYQLTGFENYWRLLSQWNFYTVFLNTLIFAVVCVILFFIVGLALALVMNHPAIKGRVIWRTLLILPWAVPTWVTALVWKFLFHGQFGPINQILRNIGLNPPDWLLQPFTAWVAIVTVNLWMSYPFFMLILIGGLNAIPDDLYEAADLDGASWTQQLIAITLPLLRPVALPALVLSAITQFQMFNTVFLMTKGGPITSPLAPGATELLLVWGYNQGFQQGQQFAYVSAFSIVVFIILLVLTTMYSRLTNATKGVYE